MGLHIIQVFIQSLLQLEYLSSSLNSQVFHSPLIALTLAYCDQCHLQCRFLEDKEHVQFIFEPSSYYSPDDDDKLHLMITRKNLLWCGHNGYLTLFFKGAAISRSVFSPIRRQEDALLSKADTYDNCVIHISEWCHCSDDA